MRKGDGRDGLARVGIVEAVFLAVDVEARVEAVALGRVQRDVLHGREVYFLDDAALGGGHGLVVVDVEGRARGQPPAGHVHVQAPRQGAVRPGEGAVAAALALEVVVFTEGDAAPILAACLLVLELAAGRDAFVQALDGDKEGRVAFEADGGLGRLAFRHVEVGFSTGIRGIGEEGGEVEVYVCAVLARRGVDGGDALGVGGGASGYFYKFALRAVGGVDVDVTAGDGLAVIADETHVEAHALAQVVGHRGRLGADGEFL